MNAPRLAFVGAGWIGRARMRAAVSAGAAEAAVVVDTDEEAAGKAAADVGCDRVATSVEDALDPGVDGVVVATPSALHAAQAIAAMERGLPVFCQKPLSRTAAEAHDVIELARRRDLLLGVDLSYREARAFAAAREAARSGEIGRVYAVDLAFHNSYGPDAAWWRVAELSGGGCVIDLGTHLLDLALSVLEGDPTVVSAGLFASGTRLPPGGVEDHAAVQLETPSGAVVRLTCSWWVPTGGDAEIQARFHGSAGTAEVRNVNGSFYDFSADLHRRDGTTPLARPPDDWGGRTLVAWARRVARGDGFDPEIESVLRVARVVDRIYGRNA